jgi:starvation-inducible outer membrane lipoprotein
MKYRTGLKSMGGHTMFANRGLPIILTCLLLSACGPPQLFPKSVTNGVDANFDFIVWRNTPNSTVDRKVQIGGKVLEAGPQGSQTIIIAAQLPIVEHPAYGPKEIGKRTGEFAIAYAGKLPPNTLSAGHRIIAVGTTQKAMVVTVEDSKRTLPTIQAFCVHIWKTGGRDIADFSSVGAGYETLEEETHCVSGY